LIPDMPRPRPPHLHRETTRHGNPVWYVRVGKGPRIRIKATYGSPDFEAAYSAAIKGERIGKPAMRSSPHSLQWLWDSYRQTENWLRLSPTTRYQRENIMAHVLKESGTAPFARGRNNGDSPSRRPLPENGCAGRRSRLKIQAGCRRIQHWAQTPGTIT
jgi:hypothetical protein